MTQSRPVRIAVQLQPQHAEYSVIRDRVRELEQLGVEILFNWDHFFPLYGEPDGLHFEAWIELASWGRTDESRRVRHPCQLQQLPQS